ncbi:MAG: ribbon-helix-helix protein, CopG family [Nitrospirae bacterium]|nr:ribbon-helix-helix protein, CopG family [Nitrospirota bacterium]
MVRINTVLTEDILKELDRIASEQRKSRSMLIREAINLLIDNYERMLKETKRREKTKRAMKIQDRLRKKSGKWNGVAEIRKWRET